jgi:hypothetical protein
MKRKFDDKILKSIMGSYNSMEAVSLPELHEWMMKNREYTWYMDQKTWLSSKREFKYFDFAMNCRVDTRDMVVYYLKLDINNKEVVITTANQSLDPIVQANKFKNILEYLEFMLKDAGYKQTEVSK